MHRDEGLRSLFKGKLITNSTGWTELRSRFDNLEKYGKALVDCYLMLFISIENSQIVGYLTILSYSSIWDYQKKHPRTWGELSAFWFIRSLNLSRSVAWQKDFDHLMITTSLHLSAHRWRHLLEDLALTTFCNQKNVYDIWIHDNVINGHRYNSIG